MEREMRQPKACRPHAGKWIAYYRVSTGKQGESGLGLDAQRAAVERYLNGGQWSLTAEFVEIESGKRSDRPQLAAALAACRKAKATLIIAKLDRLSRNVAFIANLMEAEVDFVCCDFPQANRLTLHILAAVAEHERSMISQRTKDALAAAQARGKKLGNPALRGDRDPGLAANAAAISAKGAATNRTKADQFAANVLPIIREVQKHNGAVSMREIARVLDARGVKTAHGSTWTSVQVGNVLKRAGGFGDR
jgi:DNA invertase Pin-like site-specific DNA recombinase